MIRSMDEVTEIKAVYAVRASLYSMSACRKLNLIAKVLKGGKELRKVVVEKRGDKYPKYRDAGLAGAGQSSRSRVRPFRQ